MPIYGPDPLGWARRDLGQDLLGRGEAGFGQEKAG